MIITPYLLEMLDTIEISKVLEIPIRQIYLTIYFSLLIQRYKLGVKTHCMFKNESKDKNSKPPEIQTTFSSHGNFNS